MTENWKIDICTRDIAEANQALRALDGAKDNSIPFLGLSGHRDRVDAAVTVSYFANLLYDNQMASTREARLLAAWPGVIPEIRKKLSERIEDRRSFMTRASAQAF